MFGDCQPTEAIRRGGSGLRMGRTKIGINGTDENWVVVKGENWLTTPTSTTRLRPGCASTPPSSPPSTARARRGIIECAEEFGGPGNSETWVTVATRHHLEVVTRQLDPAGAAQLSEVVVHNADVFHPLDHHLLDGKEASRLALLLRPHDDDTIQPMRVTLRDLRLPADVIVVSRDYAERWRDVRGSLVHAALSQCRVLAR